MSDKPKQMPKQPVSGLVQKDLTQYHAYEKVAQDGRTYFKLTTNPETTTTLLVGGVATDIVASFRAVDYQKPNVIYLEIAKGQYDTMIQANGGMNTYWCKEGVGGNPNSIIGEEDYASLPPM